MNSNLNHNIHIEKFVVGPLKENTYILHDQNQECIIIDPGDEEEDKIVNYLKIHNLYPKKILITHAHFDHVGALNTIYQLYKPQIYLYELDYDLYQNIDKQLALFGLPTIILPPLKPFDRYLDQIFFFNQSFYIIHTPGHTRGSVCFFYPENQILFTGDTLLYESIGRTDLPGTQPDQIIPSIKNNLLNLDENIVIYPGHMQSSTIGHEKKYNPFFQEN